MGWENRPQKAGTSWIALGTTRRCADRKVLGTPGASWIVKPSKPLHSALQIRGVNPCLGAAWLAQSSGGHEAGAHSWLSCAQLQAEGQYPAGWAVFPSAPEEVLSRSKRSGGGERRTTKHRKDSVTHTTSSFLFLPFHAARHPSTLPSTRVGRI